VSRFARHLLISGRVQGVFFRAWTKERADQLGVTGWVRNCADGSVEALLEGNEPAVRKLVEQLHHGPPSAQVTQVVVEEAAPQENGQFEVRH